MRDKASQRTNKWLLDDVYPNLTDDECEQIRAAVMFYVLAGWERHYPYPDMPLWLRDRWWHPAANLALIEGRG